MNIDLCFRPRIFETFRDYNREKFLADLIAGITVGIVALPLAMALGISSGVTPQAGIFTAVIAGFLISALGGSRVQIGGPTAAFIAIVLSIIGKYGLEGLFISTIIAGVLLLIMGLTKMGSLIKFIPYPITMGFTSGIAVLIFTTQIRDFFGLSVEKVPAEFIERIKVLAEHLNTTHWPTFALGAASLAVIRFWPKKLAKRVPGSIVAMILGTVAVALFHIPTETIGTKFGGIPQQLPTFRMPNLSWAEIQHLFQPALTIALLAGIESLLSAVVADGMIDDRHDSNQELVAQGIANIVSPFFGGICATGAIARTATNVRSGAHSPVAGIIHAITLLVIILAAAPLAKYVPLATLSAVLIVVAMNMGEWHHFRRLAKWPKSDAAVFLVTFILTVVTDLTFAVMFGMLMGAALFIRRISDTTQIMAVDQSTETEGAAHSLIGKDIPKGVMVYQVFGAFLFGAADKLETALKRANQEPDVLILRMRRVFAMDATGLNALEDLYEKLRKRGKHLVLCAPHTQPLLVMDKGGFVDTLGRDNICADLDASLGRARSLLARK